MFDEQIRQLLLTGVWETLKMTIISTVFAYILYCNIYPLCCQRHNDGNFGFYF